MRDTEMLFNLFSALRRRFDLARYDDFTIAKYFRRQGARIGENCRIMIRSLGSEPYLVSIGNHCTLAPGVALTTHDGGAWVFASEHPDLQRFGRIEILDNCFVGMRAIILPGVRIGPNAVVGAGAVVTRDVPPNSVVAGCPATVVSSLDAYKQKILRDWIQQRPPSYMEEVRSDRRYTAAQIQRSKERHNTILRHHLEKLFVPGK